MKQIIEKINIIAAYAVAVSAILIVLITSIDQNCFDKGFYAKEYSALNTAQSLGMTEEDLNRSTNTLLDYLKDKRDDIQVEIQLKGTKVLAFNDREASHMVDVKNLYQFALILRYVCIGVLLISILYLIFQYHSGIYTHISIAYMKTAILFTVFFVMLGIWAYADFNAFWTAFHRLAFRNDLWLLDPSTDLMINLFPSEFFYKLVFRIVGWFAAGFGSLFVVSYIYLRHQLHKVHKELMNHEHS
ncbi:TIGR01906 family membrane protein [[Eubacterium] hominis]|uniref:TIGR01906 family membrane protein n=1 Tax=[Eubacterium] hominis TaxID=2764325 RepID=UPI003A4DCFCA